MKIFLDTSTLFKLYHYEDGSEEVMTIFKENRIDTISLSEITKIEFDSVVWKKFRKKELDEEKAKAVIKNFEKDWSKFNFIKDNNKLKDIAKSLVSKYGKEGLRTLDSIQLASAISVRKNTELFLTSDNLLQDFFKQENLPIAK